MSDTFNRPYESGTNHDYNPYNADSRHAHFKAMYPTYDARAKAVDDYQGTGTGYIGGRASAWGETYDHVFGYDEQRVARASNDTGYGTIHSADPLLMMQGDPVSGNGLSPSQRAAEYKTSYAAHERSAQADHDIAVRNSAARGHKLGPMRSTF